MKRFLKELFCLHCWHSFDAPNRIDPRCKLKTKLLEKPDLRCCRCLKEGVYDYPVL